MDATTTQAVALLRRLRKEVERRQALTALCDVRHPARHAAFERAYDVLSKTRYYKSRRRPDVRLAAIDRAIATLEAQS